MKNARPFNKKKMYNRAWQQARKLYLRDNPLCVDCARRGITKASCIVDHKIPHRGDERLFWDTTNWQALCKECHDSFKQAYENTGFYRGVDVDGIPTDAGHWWNHQSTPFADPKEARTEAPHALATPALQPPGKGGHSQSQGVRGAGTGAGVILLDKQN